MTADPELKTTPSGIPVCTFLMAVNRNYKGPDGKTAADFLTVTAWRQTAEFVTRYFRKSSGICVVGSIQTRSWVDANGQKRFATDIVADEVYFVDALKDSPMGRDHSQPAGGGVDGFAGGEHLSDVVVDPSSPAMAGASSDTAAGGKGSIYSTPGARGEIEAIDGDGELPF